MTLDAAIREDKTFLKKFIRHYEQELNNKDFTEIYKHFDPHRSIWVGGATEYGDEYDCRSFTALLLKNNINPLKYMDEVPEYFAYGLNIKEFIIPNNIIEISPCAFEDCSILTNITIGSGTTLIYNSVFSNCERLASITIPKSVVYIGQAAFRNCSKLKDVYYEGSEEDWKNIEIEWWCNELLRNANIHYNS